MNTPISCDQCVPTPGTRYICVHSNSVICIIIETQTHDWKRRYEANRAHHHPLPLKEKNFKSTQDICEKIKPITTRTANGIEITYNLACITTVTFITREKLSKIFQLLVSKVNPRSIATITKMAPDQNYTTAQTSTPNHDNPKKM